MFDATALGVVMLSKYSDDQLGCDISYFDYIWFVFMWAYLSYLGV